MQHARCILLGQKSSHSIGTLVRYLHEVSPADSDGAMVGLDLNQKSETALSY